MLYSLDPESSALLLRIPESGMGYQVVGYQQQLLVVIHAVIAFDLNDFELKGFFARNQRYFIGNPYAAHFGRLAKLEFETAPTLVFSDFFQPDLGAEATKFDIEGWSLRSSQHVATIPKSRATSPPAHAYYRFSAFSIDKRREPDTGNYLPGTYATTYNDIHHVPSGFAAVGRYALPNPAAARFIHPIVTFDQPTHTGTATPNFGQAGGGVEVHFANGATNRPDRSFTIDDA